MLRYTPERLRFLQRLAEQGKVDPSKWPTIEPENLHYWEAFLDCERHAIDGMSGALSVQGVESWLRVHGVPERRWPTYWRIVSTLSRKAAELRKAREDADGEPSISDRANRRRNEG